ncbi:hypothetical protein [Wolbachia endosymbiont of Ctenocephalides felis wCfeT]|uniref:hypothetical protein n=1 Tax=Wolbachia endosymbiont of Ctenocephalides felis wCfeT TaxID=2732593 RepID=UPI001FE94072|nr:hypothetical protein [Wolbachia endosymbiont of Ctenocephalides felis wCfeT]
MSAGLLIRNLNVLTAKCCNICSNFILLSLVYYFIFSPLSAQSQVENNIEEEFIPTPKRKKDIAKQQIVRQIIEVQEEFNPEPSRKKDLKPIYDDQVSEENSALEERNKSQVEKETQLEKKTNENITVKPIAKQNTKKVITEIIDSIRNQLAKCWSISENMAHTENFNIKINLLLSNKGEVVMADVAENYTYHNNPLFRSIADTAMRAVYKCSPFNNLPIEHYHIWREITLDFILK